MAFSMGGNRQSRIFLRGHFVAPIASITWTVLEEFGTWFPGFAFWKMMPSALRIVFHVLIVVAIVTGIVAIRTYGGIMFPNLTIDPDAMRGSSWR